MEQRVNLLKVSPQLYETMTLLETQVGEYAKAAGIADGFKHILKLRASQLNGCAFCLRMHTRDALKAGETSDRLAVLPGWRESSYYDEKEGAALALVEAITQIGEGQVPSAVYEQAKSVLNEEEIAAIEWIAVTINAWNRLAISSRTPVQP